MLSSFSGGTEGLVKPPAASSFWPKTVCEPRGFPAKRELSYTSNNRLGPRGPRKPGLGRSLAVDLFAECLTALHRAEAAHRAFCVLGPAPGQPTCHLWDNVHAWATI